MIKKIVQSLAFLACLLLVNSAFSQVAIGPKVGVNFSNVSVDTGTGIDIDTEGKTDLGLGLALELPVSQNFMIQPELSYLGRGYKSNSFGSGELTTNVAYVDLGALAKVRFGETIGVYLGAGPFFSYAISGKIKDDSGDTDIDFDTYKRSDVTLAGALGIEFGSRDALRFFGDIRYLAGLNDLNNDNALDFKLRNRLFNINVGVMVPL